MSTKNGNKIMKFQEIVKLTHKTICYIIKTTIYHGRRKGYCVYFMEGRDEYVSEV